MGVCCRYALSMVIPRRLRDCSYSPGRDFSSVAISLASFPGTTGNTNAVRDILYLLLKLKAKGHRTTSSGTPWPEPTDTWHVPGRRTIETKGPFQLDGAAMNGGERVLRDGRLDLPVHKGCGPKNRERFWLL